MESKSHVVFSRDIKPIVKKKYIVSSKDKKDWTTFTKEMHDISTKKVDLLEKNTTINKTQKLDLHGYSLDEANKIIKKFIRKKHVWPIFRSYR